MDHLHDHDLDHLHQDFYYLDLLGDSFLNKKYFNWVYFDDFLI